MLLIDSSVSTRLKIFAEIYLINQKLFNIANMHGEFPLENWIRERQLYNGIYEFSQTFLWNLTVDQVMFSSRGNTLIDEGTLDCLRRFLPALFVFKLIGLNVS